MRPGGKAHQQEYQIALQRLVDVELAGLLGFLDQRVPLRDWRWFEYVPAHGHLPTRVTR
jgi:hypothetical protein